MPYRYEWMRLTLCSLLLAGSLHAEIATSPLTTQTWVPPNVVVTLDDSGSMHDECIPSTRCLRAEEGLNIGSVMRYLRHDHLDRAAQSKSISSVPYANNNLFAGLATYDAGVLLARQIRSVSTNPTYYNPNLRYTPWLRADGSSYGNANPYAAPYDPLDPANTLDLTTSQTVSANYCATTVLNQCTSSAQSFIPAQYYVQNPNTTGNQLSDFTQVIISQGVSFPKASDRKDCAGSRCSVAEELTNFANWFTYYGPTAKYLGDQFTVLPVTYRTDNLLARQLRSPSLNSSYYNPARRYTPWMYADRTQYPNADPAAAPYNPNRPAYALDLTQQITASEKFCTGVSRSQCQAATETFYPAQYYLLTAGTDGTQLSHFTQININTDGDSFPKYNDRTDCAGTSCTRIEELQNFANWFTYYRTKWLAAKAVISQTFQVIPGATRLGYGVISLPNTANNSIDGEPTGVLVKGVREFTDTGRQDFYNWLLALNTNTTGAGTPLRRAMIEVGNYYMRDDNAGPWAETPGGTSSAAHLVCRRALHLLITDGAWTESDRTQLTNVKTGHGNQSVATYSLLNQNVDGTDARPFQDSYANTLADVAMYYWKTDLRSDLSGKVNTTQSEKDLGRDTLRPHMVNYIIGFGVNGTLVNPSDGPALIAGSKNWPAIGSESSKVDDLWHAAWNSGGLSFSANDPKALSLSLERVIESMKEQAGSDAPLVLPSRFVSADYAYIPSYKSKTWSGDLLAYTFNRATGDRAKGSDGKYAAAIWSAATQLNAQDYSARNIYTYNNGGLRFDFNSLNNAGLIGTLTSNSAQAAKLIDYLRGDASLEGTRYRARPNGKLGDIVNSPPLLVLDGEDALYDYLPDLAEGRRGNYRQFLLDKKKRKGLVFVGANDGMLHAFDARTGDEAFAFIPKTVLGDVYRLSAMDYAHRYFVDGPLVEADVYDNTVTPSASDTAWRNIVVGTGGAGARNLFAIRVPVAANGSANTVYPPQATDILWEKNNNDSGLAALGYVLQKPSVGMMRDGTWVVITGNGYVNSGGTAQLLILNALTGALIKSIDVPMTGNNGLGGVRLVLDLQRRISAAYAGDLQGNLWKFDFSSNVRTDWGLAFGGKPLFKAESPASADGTTAAQPQPITASPVYLAHPQGGNLVVFGTGKLFELADANDNSVQALYGVWDKVLTGDASGAAAALTSADLVSPSNLSSINTIVRRSSLVEQDLSAVGNTGYYSATNKLVNYPEKRGWYIQLSMSPNGLRLVFAPQLAVGKVFLQTISPLGNAADACAERTGKTVNFLLNPLTGSSSQPTFDVNRDGKISAADMVDSQNNPINAVAQTSEDISNANFSQKIGANAVTGVLTFASGQTTVNGSGGALRRTWRHIVNRPQAGAVAPSASN